MILEHYLNRIGVDYRENCDLPYLSLLQQQHVKEVAFENIDIMSHTPLSLRINDLYEKIVIRKRGGICHELNGLFHELLVNLGFEAYLVPGTTRPGERWFPIENTHLFNLVTVDHIEYLVDVGLGGNSPGKPVPLTGEEIKDVDGWYRLTQDGDTYYLQKKTDQDWSILYKFMTIKKRLEDFEQICSWMQTSPESPFNKRLFLSKVTERGRVTLASNSLTIVIGNDKTKEE